MVLNGVKNMLLGVSLFEILVFVVSIMFLLGPSSTGLQLWMLIFNLSHLVRATLGIYMSRLVPQTWDVLGRFYSLN